MKEEIELKINTNNLKVFKVLNRIARTCTLTVDESGMKTEVMDFGDTIYQKAFIPMEKFKEFKVKEKQEIGIDLKYFTGILTLFGAYHDIVIKVKHNKLIVKDEDKAITMSLEETEQVKTPSINTNIFKLKEFGFEMSSLRKALKFANFSGEGSKVILVVKNGELYCEGNGVIASFKNKIGDVKEGLEKQEKEEVFKSAYDVEKLDNLTRGMSGLSMSFGSNTPLELKGTIEWAEIYSLLAPTIIEAEEPEAEKQEPEPNIEAEEPECEQEPITEPECEQEEKAVVKATA